MSLYSRLDRLAADVEKLDRKVDSVSNSPQAQRTSIEAGTMDINDEDGNLVSTIGLQEDGSGATRFFDGPIPPVPSGFTALADGPIIQGTWDGTFGAGLPATYDRAYREIAATLVDDDTRVSFATISAKEGASASVVANQSGTWAVAVRSVSQAGKKSEFFSAGTVEVKLVDLAGAIEAVQDSANGKNKVHHSARPPTPDDPGIFDDTWFVGQVGRPEDLVESTNLNPNPSFEMSPYTTGYSSGSAVTLTTFGTAGYQTVGERGARADYAGSTATTAWVKAPRIDISQGQWIGSGVWLFARTGSKFVRTRIIFRNSAGSAIGSSPYLTPYSDTSSAFRYLSGAAQAPAGTVAADPYFYAFDTSSGSVGPVAGTQISFDGWSLVVSATEAGALSAVGTYFDGDTSSGATDNESHYRWAGEPHASISEKYLPALDIGDSSNWNIIEQYRHDGTGWVKVELSHWVISTMDLGKATVGELDGIRIKARTISTEQLRADFADFVVARGGTFLTTNNNGEFSDRGLFFQQPDGTAILRVPTDGGPISLSASDTQIRRAQVDELEVIAGSVRSGGTFTLAAGVTPPASPPELNAQWQRIATLTVPDVALSFDWTGLAYWAEGDGHWVRGVNVLGSEGDTQDAVEVYSMTGEFEQAFLVDINPRAGVTVIGDIVYTIGPSHSRSATADQYMSGYSLVTGQRVSSWAYTNFFATNQKKIAIGNDGTNVLVGGIAPNGTMHVMRYNMSNGAMVADMQDASWNLSVRDVNGVRQIGSDLYFTHTNATRVYTVSGSTITRKPDPLSAAGWAGWLSDGVQGMDWVDGRPHIVGAQGSIFAGSGFDSDATIQSCFTWFDGSNETTPSPVATVSVPARNAVSISMAKRAGLQKRLYVRKGTTGTWTRETLGEDVTSFVEADGNAGLYQLPTTNTFPNSTPASMKSANSNFEAKGDGSGKWGPLTFNANGTMTGIPKMAHGTVVLTPSADNTTVTAAVTFPQGRFSQPPSVVVSPDTTVPGTNVLGVSTTGITATKFDAVLRRTNAVASRMYWIALGE